MKLLILCGLIALAFGRQGFGPGEQEWGYVTVREDAHMFWWLYLTTAEVKTYEEKPLIIWLQGGPGASSTGYGNFAELGPLDLDRKPRDFTWVKDANVLFIDNPVGTGYSYVDSAAAYTRDNKQIAEDLVALMKGFYEKMPSFKTVPLYITAESYGGKMAAEFGLVLDKAIKDGEIECNLKGVGLGDSWVSPIDSVLTWAPYLLHFGAVDQAGYDKIESAALETKRLLEAGRFVDATDMWRETEYVVMDVTHDVDFYNVLKKIGNGYSKHSGKIIAKPSARDLDDVKLDILMNGDVKKALDLNVRWGAQSGAVFSYLSGDFMKANTEVVEQLLNSTDIKVFVFSGQLDLIVDTPGTVLWVDRLNWAGKKQWETAKRNVISVEGINEGYRKEVGNLGLYWVNRAGHMVPADNPKAMDFILRKLTNDYAA
ncbi:PREDICTED: retinoid-inducible serine carboxypeptidase-like [Nicrophorus vespilloides]|uniref:Carboxypeptidase n=1 Tax=Nicrophorus vespilloides TaxID=110193 RepID=A0ABM1MC23_NICVS|nr:PREDICTED: retinoid-inducible serine carboxypeptidase-like [Nicrophorus vespilloides]